MAAQKHMPIAIGYGVTAPIEPTIWAASPASAICRKPESPEAAPAACGSTLTTAACAFAIAEGWPTLLRRRGLIRSVQVYARGGATAGGTRPRDLAAQVAHFEAEHGRFGEGDLAIVYIVVRGGSGEHTGQRPA
jgi:hypothetical protein